VREDLKQLQKRLQDEEYADETYLGVIYTWIKNHPCVMNVIDYFAPSRGNVVKYQST
jgi:hypothetical protein